MFLQFLINGFITGLIYSLAALGFAVVYNTTRIFHLAYAGLYVVSQYFIYYWNHTAGLSLQLSIVLSVIMVAILSLLIELIVYRPFYKKHKSSNAVMISSLGVLIILINVIALVFGSQTQSLIRPFEESLQIGNLIITQNQLIQLVGIACLLTTGFVILKFSNFGLRMRAMRDDNELFQLYGYNILLMRTIIFLISGALIALTGAFTSIDIGMDPYVGMPLLLNAVVSLIIGGIGRFRSALFGGILIGIVQAITVWQFSSQWSTALTFLVLLIFLFFRPQGITGEVQRKV